MKTLFLPIEIGYPYKHIENVTNVDFLLFFAYTKKCIRRGCPMNQFEKEVQSNRNDAVDSAVGFVVSFGFFATVFAVAILIDLFV